MLIPATGQKLHYEIAGTWQTKDFIWSSNFAGKSYWQTVLANGVEVNNGDSVNFYVEASDYNGPILVDDNNGNNYNVILETPPVPIAQFEADVVTGNEPLQVQFTDLSSNYPDTWMWDFGDGSTSTEQNPTHVYEEGYFTVTLAVTNAAGTDTETKTNYIHVLEALNIPTDFTAIMVNYFDVQTSWNPPSAKEKELQFYRLYRNQIVCAVVYPPTTDYLDTELDVGIYEYYVTAKYSQGESMPSDTVTIEIENLPPVADAGADQTVDEMMK